jgi:hypothetical protein
VYWIAEGMGRMNRRISPKNYTSLRIITGPSAVVRGRCESNVLPTISNILMSRCLALSYNLP